MINRLLSLALSFLLLPAVFAAGGPLPEKQAWKKKFPGNIKWYKLTDAGIVVVCTSDALYGIDPNTGGERWKKEDLKNLQEENYDPIEASPMIALVDRGLTPAHIVMDVYSGKVLVNSKEAGLYNVSKRFVDAELGGIFFFGVNKNGKPLMMLIDAATGEKRWEVEKIFEKATEQIVSAPYALNGEVFMLATTRGVYKINSRTGAVLWNAEMKNEAAVAAPQAKGGMFSSFNAFKNVNKAQTAMTTATNSRFFLLDKYSDRVFFYSQDHFTAFSLADGKELWTRLKLKSPVASIIYDSHGLLVATAENDDDEKKSKGLIGKLADKNKAKLMCLDYDSGRELWKDHLDIAGDVVFYRYADMNTLVLATANEKGKNRIDIVNLADGSTRTKNPFKVDGDIQDIRMVPQGLLYRTTEEMNILDLGSAKDAWSKSVKFKTGSMGVDRENYCYIYGDGKVYRFDNARGEYEVLLSGITFEGGERPSGAELRENGILFTSSQNMLLTDFNGNKIYQVYRKAPGKSAAAKVFFGALAAMAMASQANESFKSGYARGSGQYSAAEYHERNAANWGNIAGASFAEFNKRFKATVESANYVSILTRAVDSEEEGVGIVLISKRSGKEEGAVVLRDKKPDYQLDEISHLVFYRNSADELTAYRF
jgi:outer membrane protein assembly factor BamB